MCYVLVLYCSRHGAVRNMAEYIAQGVERQQTRFEARIRTVPPISMQADKNSMNDLQQKHILVTHEDLNDCAGLALGSPTRFGNMAAPMKYFIDTTVAAWINGSLINKPACVFTSTSSLHGGQETTLLSMMLPLIHQGMIILGLPYSEDALGTTTTGGTPYGVTHVTFNDHDRALSEDEKQLCIAQGKRLTELVVKLQS